MVIITTVHYNIISNNYYDCVYYNGIHVAIDIT